MPGLSRRELLELAIAELVVLPAWAGLGCGPGGPTASGTREGVGHYFGTDRLARAAVVGRAALPADSSAERESAVEFAGAALRLLEAATGPAEAVEALRQALRADLREGRIVDVEGWTLGRTEVELCVLASLDDT